MADWPEELENLHMTLQRQGSAILAAPITAVGTPHVRLPPPTEAQIAAALEAEEQAACIQGFHYGPEFVIRDILRSPANQVIWRGPDSDAAAFDRQMQVERMRIVLQAAFNATEITRP